MGKYPMISVIMSTYNTPNKWLYESIESILNQSFTDFEFLIVDDCSETNLDEIKNYFDDSRIKWIKNETNLGLTKSLNKLLKMAKGKYIARMDSDDIAYPNRLEIQVKYMEKNLDIIVSGTYRESFGNENKSEIWNIPKTRKEQQVQLFLFNCGLTHPTAMFRKSMLDQFNIMYNENYIKAQDYGIWVQCTRYAPMAIIPIILLKYRKSNQQISNAGRQNQLENDIKVKLDQLEFLSIKATEKQKKIHIAFCQKDTNIPIENVEKWVSLLKKANNSTKYFDEKIFDKVISRQWYEWCKKKYLLDKNIKTKKYYKKAQKFSYIINEYEIFLKQILLKIIRK